MLTGQSRRVTLRLAALLALTLLLAACYPNPQPAGLTPIPTLAPGAELTPVGVVTGEPTPEATANLPTPAAQGAATTQAPTPAGGGGGATAGNAAQGKAIFAQNCSPCHGQNGQGGGVGPKLAGNDFIKSSDDQKIYDTIANGRPGTAMPAWSQAKGGSLSDQQIHDVIAYLHTLQ